MTAPLQNPLRAESGMSMPGPGRLVLRLRVEQVQAGDAGSTRVSQMLKADIAPAPRRARFSWPWFWGSAALGASLAAAMPPAAMPSFASQVPQGLARPGAQSSVEMLFATHASSPGLGTAVRPAAPGIGPVSVQARKSPSLPIPSTLAAGSSGPSERAAPMSPGKLQGAWMPLQGPQAAGGPGRAPQGSEGPALSTAVVGIVPDAARVGVQVADHRPGSPGSAVVGQLAHGVGVPGDGEAIGDAGGETAGSIDPLRFSRADGPSVRLVTVVDSSTIVVTDPITRLPRPVEVGGVLHDGSRLLAVDVQARTALTDRATLRLE